MVKSNKGKARVKCVVVDVRLGVPEIRQLDGKERRAAANQNKQLVSLEKIQRRGAVGVGEKGLFERLLYAYKYYQYKLLKQQLGQ